TNFSGLYRYRILDIVHVTSMYNNSPRIEFLYRSNMGMNLANEKTTTQMLDWVAAHAEEKFGISFKGYSFYPESECETPHYCMLVETESDLPTTKREEMEKFLDESFRECNEKYDKYRVWGMIHPLKLFHLENGAYDEYKKGLLAQGRVLNQIKPVTVINTPEREEFFFSKVKSGEPVKGA
ncbi:MAG: GH3 auxin-responsive promoter family protein, partial [Ruminococcus sp.]|nr:GH3 auxin-responsive promoter family protein [Ruminococcus sp.]